MIHASTVRGLFALRDLLLPLHNASPPPDILYHYTDAKGFLGILRTRALWATHHQYLNDAREFTYATDLLKKVADDAAKDAAKNAAAHSPTAKLRDTIFRPAENSILDFYNEVKDEGEMTVHWLTCFSEHRDDLSQWRGYAQGISGYSIGIASQKLLNIAEDIKDAQFKEHVDRTNEISVQAQLLRCEYKEGVQLQLMQKAFEIAAKHCHETTPDADYARLAGAIPRSLTRIYKDPSFGSEGEWRLVISVQMKKDTGQSKKPKAIGAGARQQLAVEFRSGEYTLIPYVAVPLSHDGSPFISSVTVGPTPLLELAHPTAIALLKSHPVPDKEVRKSKVPFRRV